MTDVEADKKEVSEAELEEAREQLLMALEQRQKKWEKEGIGYR